ncbi:UNVERIFIED_CONTAM: hypothetical protein K2H54_007992 [Gekko kuhli]
MRREDPAPSPDRWDNPAGSGLESDREENMEVETHFAPSQTPDCWDELAGPGFDVGVPDEDTGVENEARPRDQRKQDTLSGTCPKTPQALQVVEPPSPSTTISKDGDKPQMQGKDQDLL